MKRGVNILDSGSLVTDERLIAFIVEPEDMRKLIQVKDRLGDIKSLAPGEQFDLSKKLYGLIETIKQCPVTYNGKDRIDWFDDEGSGEEDDG